MNQKPWIGRTQRYLLAGILTLIPIWITWAIFTFIFTELSQFGLPWVRAIAGASGDHLPALAQTLLNPWFQSAVAVLLTLAGLYLLGFAASRVIGRRLIGLFDNMMHRIPLVQSIYGGTKKLLAALQQKPDDVQRVVLIEFPCPGMKTVGLVTRILTDETSGRHLAAVYVPTTPNPTSGYLEIVPVEQLVSTDWTMDQAMTFIISGGTVAPESIHYTRPAVTGEDADEASRSSPHSRTRSTAPGS